MSEITWDELTDYEREVLALMPDFWTHHTMLPLLVQDRMLSTVLPLAMRGVLIECYTDDASYRRTEAGRALVEAAHVVHNENGVPVALHDGWHEPKGDQRYEALVDDNVPSPEMTVDISGWSIKQVDEYLRSQGYDPEAIGLMGLRTAFKASTEASNRLIAELVAERDALKAALKPFAEVGDDLDEWDDDSMLYMEFTYGYYPIYLDMSKPERLMVGHLKAAARALKAESDGE